MMTAVQQVGEQAVEKRVPWQRRRLVAAGIAEEPQTARFARDPTLGGVARTAFPENSLTAALNSFLAPPENLDTTAASCTGAFAFGRFHGRELVLRPRSAIECVATAGR